MKCMNVKTCKKKFKYFLFLLSLDNRSFFHSVGVRSVWTDNMICNAWTLVVFAWRYKFFRRPKNISGPGTEAGMEYPRVQTTLWGS